jgi:hypothetical protein
MGAQERRLIVSVIDDFEEVKYHRNGGDNIWVCIQLSQLPGVKFRDRKTYSARFEVGGKIVRRAGIAGHGMWHMKGSASYRRVSKSGDGPPGISFEELGRSYGLIKLDVASIEEAWSGSKQFELGEART